jgi:hypothetical protein
VYTKAVAVKTLVVNPLHPAHTVPQERSEGVVPLEGEGEGGGGLLPPPHLPLAPWWIKAATYLCSSLEFTPEKLKP